MKEITISSSGAIRCRAALDLPLCLTSVWGQIRDFDTFAQLDLFHSAIRIEGGVARQGAALEMQHRYGPFAVRRIGRILVWKENFGYSFSDLSRRGPRKGFPHVFSYRLESTSEQTCRLQISVTGRWTARFIPRPVAKLWLWWVFSQVMRGVEQRLLIYQIWRKRNARVKPVVRCLY